MKVTNIDETIVRADLPKSWVGMVRDLTIRALLFLEKLEDIPKKEQPMMVDILTKIVPEEVENAQAGIQFLREFPEIQEWLASNFLPNRTQEQKEQFEVDFDLMLADLYEKMKAQWYLEKGPHLEQLHKQWRANLPSKETVIQVHDEPPGEN